jgi:hypothetical protein
MKSLKPRVLWVDRVGDRGSCVILTQNFWWEEAAQHKRGKKRGCGCFHPDRGGHSGGAHSFLAERGSERPAAVKGARFERERSVP